MKTISIISAIITGLLLLSTLLCGLWIKANQLTDADSIGFHVKLGIAAVAFGLISIVLLIIQAAKN